MNASTNYKKFRFLILLSFRYVFHFLPERTFVIYDKSMVLSSSSPFPKLFYTYIVQCSDQTLYTGYTADLKARLDAHNGKKACGARYTRSRRPVRLVYSRAFLSKSEAMSSEQKIKHMSRKQKDTLIQSHLCSYLFKI